MEYVRILPYHNAIRWLVLFSAAWSLAQSWHGLLRKRTWARCDTYSGLVFTTLANVQFIVGLFLLVTSPYVRPVFTAPDYAFSSGTAFFLSVYHPAMMFVAIGLAQAIYLRTKSLAEDRRRFRWAAYGYSLCFVMILAAIPWPFYSFGRPLLRQFPSTEASVAPSVWDYEDVESNARIEANDKR